MEQKELGEDDMIRSKNEKDADRKRGNRKESGKKEADRQRERGEA